MPFIGNAGQFSNIYEKNYETTTLRVVEGDAAYQAYNPADSHYKLITNLQEITDTGNVTSNTLQFSNAITGFTTTSNVGIANSTPTHTLDVGSKAYIDENASNTFWTSGTLYADKVLSETTEITNSVTTRDVLADKFFPKTNGFIEVTSNVGVLNTAPVHTLDIGANVQIDEYGSNTFWTSGNVYSEHYKGSNVTVSGSVDTDQLIVNDINSKDTDFVNFTSNVGVLNTAPVHTLDIGANVQIDEYGSNTFWTSGNVYSEHYKGSNVTVSGSVDTDQLIVNDINSKDTDFVNFTSNVGVLNTAPVHTLDIGANVQIDEYGSNTFWTSGNVHANKYTGTEITLTGTIVATDFILSGGSELNPTPQLQTISEVNPQVGQIAFSSDRTLTLSNVTTALDATNIHAITTHSNLIGNNVTAVTVNSNLIGNNVTAVTVNSNLIGNNVTAVTVNSNLIAGNVTVDNNLIVNTDDFVVDTVNSKVGINKASPTKDLDVTGEIECSSHLTVGGDISGNGDAVFRKYTIASPGSGQYSVIGPGFDTATVNPTLTLMRGQKYVFDNTVHNNGHPLEIRDGNGGSAYTDGVSGGGTATITFTVPMDAPIKLYYQCINHPAMGNIIYIPLDSIDTTMALILSNNLVVNTDDLVVDTVNSKVGINKASPTKDLDVTGEIECSSHLTVGGDISGNGDAVFRKYTIANPQAGKYSVIGPGFDTATLNPTLTLMRGQKYVFDNTVHNNGHPLEIRDGNGGSAYTDGVSGGGTATITFTVPMDAPLKLYYQCIYHASMGNTIYIPESTLDTTMALNLSNNLVVTGTSNVGIGTSTPAYTLDVHGTANVGALTATSVSGDGSGLSSIQSSNVTDFASNVTRIGTLETDLESNVTRIGTLESGDLTIGGEKTFSSNLEVGTANLFVDTTTGNVGVGTTSPGTKLDVVGHPHAFIRKTAQAGTATDDYNHILGGPRPGTTSAGAVHFINGSARTSDGGTDTYTIRNDSGRLRLGNASFDTLLESNVGVGVSNPAHKLDVDGDINIASGSNLKIGGTNAVFSNWTVSGSDIYRSSGNVGIGTTSPGYKLHVNGSSMFTSGMNLTTSSGYAAFEMGGPSGAYIDLKKPASDDYDLRIITTGTGGSIQVGAAGDVMNFDGSGNVGIGTTSPGYKLDVHGSSNVGALTATSVSGDGSGLTSLNASNLASGTVPSARLSLAASDIPNLDATKITSGTITVDVDTSTVTIDDYLIHDGDTNTKVGFPANDTFTVTTANSERLRVDSSGNVGIGTTSPSTALDVTGGYGYFRQGTMIGDYGSHGHTQHRTHIKDGSGSQTLYQVFLMRKNNNWTPGVIKLYWARTNVNGSGFAGNYASWIYNRYSASGITTALRSGSTSQITLGYSTAGSAYDEIQITISGTERIIVDIEISDVYGFVM